jgi:sarcosine oxidase subunit gamma
MADLRRAGVLPAEVLDIGRVRLAAIQPTGQVVLRGEHALLAPVIVRLGGSLPDRPCTIARGANSAVWLAPDRWLLLARNRDGASLAAEITEMLAGASGLAADVTEGLAVIDATGEDALAAIGTGTGLDLDPRRFGLDRAVRTHLGGVDALLYRPDDGAGLRFHVGRALAHHLWAWLEALARDWSSEAVG